uniref:C-type lectin domain-containing protein n=1 Tax=Gouania willdenowi TaxID=441366 RepID=A0A8C5EGX9_GOUWI
KSPVVCKSCKKAQLAWTASADTRTVLALNCSEQTVSPIHTGHSDRKTYHLIKDSKKWKEARDYCREHHIDLAMIESQRENEQFLLEKHTPLVWIGMYRVPWRWSDGSTSLFRNWRDGQPNNFNGEQHCGVIKMSHVWDDDNCDNAKPFFCQKSKTFTSSCWSTSFPIPLFLAPVQVRKTKLVSPHLLLFCLDCLSGAVPIFILSFLV